VEVIVYHPTPRHHLVFGEISKKLDISNEGIAGGSRGLSNPSYQMTQLSADAFYLEG
jgi:hypothetical protein